MDESILDANGNNYGYGQPQYTPFGDDVSDETNVSTINTWVREAVTWHDVMLNYQNAGVRYYLGDQTERALVAPYNSNSVYNRIFEGTETIVPIVTGSAHQFVAVPGTDDELSLKRAQKVQKVLTYKYEQLEVQHKLENVTRDIILKRFGVMKWFWNIFTNDIDVKTVDPRLILIPKLRIDANDPWLPYVIEVQEYTREEIKDYFPDIDESKLVFGRTIEISTNPTILNQWDAPIYQVLEVTTNEYKCWKQGDIILKKMKNPYFDWDGTDTEKKDTKPNGKVITTTYKVFNNHLAYPQKEYVFFNPFTSGDAPVAETSLAEIVIPIQDDINTQKRQIINNLLKMGNGQVYLDSDSLPKELADQITSEPGLILEGKNLASENRIRREAGVALPQAHFENLQASIASFDDVFGTHSAVRGAGGSSTLGGTMIDRQQDLSRIDQITRVLNRGVARVANGLVQMMRMYYDANNIVRILGQDGTVEFIKFNKDEIDSGIVIYVKSGIPPQLDTVAKYNQAIQLWQLGAIAPETLFERLDFADPQAEAQKLLAWKQGQNLFDSQLRQNEAMVGAQAKAAAAPAAGGGATDRNVETPANVVDRARQSLGNGGAAPLSNVPNTAGQPQI